MVALVILIILIFAAVGYVIRYFIVRRAVRLALEETLPYYTRSDELLDAANKQLEAINRQNEFLEKHLLAGATDPDREDG